MFALFPSVGIYVGVAVSFQERNDNQGFFTVAYLWLKSITAKLLIEATCRPSREQLYLSPKTPIKR